MRKYAILTALFVALFATSLFVNQAQAQDAGAQAPGAAVASGPEAQNLEAGMADAGNPEQPIGPAQKAAANTPEVQKIEAEIADSGNDDQPVDPGQKIQELIDDYNTNGMGRVFLSKRDKNQLYYTTGMAPVKVPADNKQWVDQRVMAYTDAMVDAQAQYMFFLSSSIRTKVIKGLVEDNEQPTFGPEELKSSSKVGSLVDKLLALGDAVLNKKLLEHGVDPEEFKAAPMEKKKTMFKDMVETQTITRAQAELTGMIPVKSFEAYDKDGNYVVAVAVVASPKLKTRMKTMMSNNWDLPPLASKVGGPTVREQIIKPKEVLLQDFGIRRIYDEEGYPVLVSFGQSGNTIGGKNFQRKMQGRQAAYEFASNDAYQNFALFLASSGQAEKITGKKAISETVGKAVAENDLVTNSEESMTSLLKKLSKSVTVQGRVDNMPGIYELHRWTLNHPANGQEVDGVILAWSPRSAKSAKELKKAYKPKPKAKPKSAKKQGAGGADTGRDLMDAADF